MRKALPSLLFPAVVVLLTFAAFLPVLGNEFLAWDDRFYITDNVKFRGLSLEHLRWMFTTPNTAAYINPCPG